MSMGKLVKVLGWYDNEWGYSNRLVDFMLYAGKKVGRAARGRKKSTSASRRSRTSRPGSARSTASGSSSAPTSTCRWSATATTSGSPTTSASAPRCRRIEWLQRARAPPSSRPATSAGPRARPTRSTRWTPVRARLAELAPGVELLENLRFDPGEEGNDPAFVGHARRGHRRLRQRRLRRVAPRPRLDRRPADASCRRRWAGCCSARSRCCWSCATTRSGRSSPCSAGPRSATSSA